MNGRRRWIIWLTILAALLLDIFPLPGWVIWLRPNWTLLVLIYWALALPYIVNVGVAFNIGIIIDLMSNTLLGEHALAATLIIYLVAKLHKQIRVFPLVQQMLLVCVMVFCYQILILCIQGFIGELPQTWLYWLPALTSAILWPWVFIILRDWRRRFGVS